MVTNDRNTIPWFVFVDLWVVDAKYYFCINDAYSFEII